MEKEIFEKTQVPRCDIIKDDEKYILRFEVPGVEIEGVDLRVEEDKLRVDAIKKLTSPEASRCHSREIIEMKYQKELLIGDTVDREKIQASLSDGILTVEIGLKEAAKSRKIAVKV